MLQIYITSRRKLAAGSAGLHARAMNQCLACSLTSVIVQIFFTIETGR